MTVVLDGQGQCQIPISGSTFAMAGLAVGGVVLAVTLGVVAFILTYSCCKRVSFNSTLNQQYFCLYVGL